METNNENQQKTEETGMELLLVNSDLTAKSTENPSENTENINENNSATDFIHQNVDANKSSEDIVKIINNNENEMLEKSIAYPSDTLEIKTDASAQIMENLMLNTTQEQYKASTNIPNTENQIYEEIIEKENSEVTENLKKYEENCTFETVKVIEDITIVPSHESYTEENVESSDKTNEKNPKEIQSKTVEKFQEISNVENTLPEKSAVKSVEINTVTKPESTFLSEATVANYINNSGLSFLQSQYGTDDSDEENDTDNDSVVEIPNQEPKNKEYRYNIFINSSDSDDSDVEYLSTEQQQKVIDLDELIDDEDDEQQNNKHKGPIRVKGELLLDDLPPIQDLKITVPETECVELGKIHSIVDQLVLVDSIAGTVPLDLDTILFMDKGKTVLGEVFDVLGQIKSPMYCVRFNSNKQIKEKGIDIGQTVFVAPRTEHTQFIILDNLMRIRGSDASWENDIEPTDKHRDFSDDEEEINYRRHLHNKDRPNDNNDLTKRARTVSTSSSMYSGSANAEQIVDSESQNNQRYNYGDNQRFPRNRRGGYQQQPRQQFIQGGGGRGRQNHYQNTSRFNYDNSGGSWHANYNSYNNNYGNYYQQQNSYHQQSQTHQRPQQLPTQQQQQTSIIAQSNLYPNPYAIRSPYIPSNVMQQPLFPPQQTYSSQIEQPPSTYPPQ